MGNIANLHSLLSGKWLITDEFANSLAPYLVNIFTKGELPKKEASKSDVFYMTPSQDILDEEDYKDEEKQQVVGVLPIKGAIIKYSQWCGPSGTRDMRSRLDKWKGDDNIVGVLLDIDSGGGQVAGTAEFADYIKNYPKPIVAYTDGLMASAAYYIASGAKEIIANKHADVIGSIGTMTKYLVVDGYFKKLGAKVVEAYASKSTKKNHAYREATKGNIEPLIKTELDPINEKFHSEIMEYRPKINSDVLDGQHLVVPEEALKKGLIDVVEDKWYAINRVFELSKESESNNVNNQNNSDMADQEITLKSISATLGMEDGLKLSSKLFGGKKGAFLTVEQLQSIESKLTEADNDLNTEKNSRTEAENKVTSLENATKEALTKASLEATDNTEASIKLLGEKVAEYGSQPGETPTSSKSEGDRFESEEDTSHIMNSLIN